MVELMELKDGEEVFTQNGVIVLDRRRSSAGSQSAEWLASGRLFVKVFRRRQQEQHHKEQELVIIFWVQDSLDSNTIKVNEAVEAVEEEQTAASSNHADHGTERHKIRPIQLELSELNSFRLSDDSNQMTLIQKDGSNINPLIFLDDGPHRFINVLKRFTRIKQSLSDENLFLVTDPRVHALDESLSQLNILDPKNTDAVWKFVSDIQKDPYNTALTTFSKLADKLIFSPTDEDMRPEDDMAELLHQSLSGNRLDISPGGGDDGSFEVITARPRLTSDLPEVERTDPLCQLDWELHFDQDGRVVDLDELKVKIFKGGVDHNIRQEVWKFLLGYYDFHSCTSERSESRSSKVEEYFKMKLQWKSMTKTQEDNFTAFRERKVQIEKDITRTDRTHSFFEGDDNPNVILLQEILMTYVMYNFDLGYVQGMSDLLSPILFVMNGDEVDSFWCFVGFMNRVKRNFDIDQGVIKNQLNQLIELQKSVNPELYAYLDAKDSGNMYFAFRWILIWFKREFSWDNLLRLWEVLWTDLPGPNFHLILCLAILDGEKSTIVENSFGFTEILKHVNDMSHNIDLDYNLKKAEAIFTKLKASPPAEYGISNASRKILGLSTITEVNHVSPTKSNIASGDDKDDSSSVEILPDLEDDTKFVNPFDE